MSGYSLGIGLHILDILNRNLTGHVTRYSIKNGVEIKDAYGPYVKFEDIITLLKPFTLEYLLFKEEWELKIKDIQSEGDKFIDDLIFMIYKSTKK